jgi:formylglycine-generating enzyme required for sulfatase activity
MPPQTVSHYRLTERIGAGSYGEVWKGVHEDDPEFVVAVKLVSPEMRSEPSFIAALRQECRALDKMDHPSIVRFRELVVRDGLVAMVLELLDGEDLEAALATGPQQIDEVVRILELALEGLAYAHGRGVLHRDIKPGNLFRCRDGRVKLMDFGLARAADGSTGTKTDTLKGTLDYMAPERFQGVTTAASDVYALGLVAWELLAGRRAAPGGDLAAKLGWHLQVGAPDVRAARPDCPAWLAEVVLAMAATATSQRPGDGGAALALLRLARGSASAGGSGGPVSRPAAPGTVEFRVPSSPAPARVGGGAASLPPSAGWVAPRPAVPSTVVVPPAPSGGGVAQQQSAHSAVADRSVRAAPAVDDDLAPPPKGNGELKVPLGVAALLALGVVGLVMSGGGSGDGAVERGIDISSSKRILRRIRGTGGGSGEGAVEPALVAEAPAAAAPGERVLGRSGYALRPVAAGAYMVGCTSGQGSVCGDDEKPPRQVTLSRAVLVGETEVPQELYQRLMGSNPSENTACGGSCPVEQVSWFDVIQLANTMSAAEGLEPCYVIEGDAVTWPKGPACLGYRLPTEAEWEVSARGGGEATYAGDNDPSTVAWIWGNSGSTTHPVGQKQANGYGLHDMSGNVSEWCWDWYDSSAYASGAVTDPVGPASGFYRVQRGGSWLLDRRNAQVADRIRDVPGNRNLTLGVRLLRTAP